MKYLLLATIGTVLFFGSYWLLMRRETRFSMVRYYLLGTLLLSLLLPLIHLPLLRQANYDGNDAAETAQLAYNTTPDGMAMTYSNTKSGVSEIKLTQDNNGMRRISLSEGETTPNGHSAHYLLDRCCHHHDTLNHKTGKITTPPCPTAIQDAGRCQGQRTE